MDKQPETQNTAVPSPAPAPTEPAPQPGADVVAPPPAEAPDASEQTAQPEDAKTIEAKSPEVKVQKPKSSGGNSVVLPIAAAIIVAVALSVLAVMAVKNS